MPWKRVFLLALALAMVCGVTWLSYAQQSQAPQQDALVGRVEGDDISVRGAVSTDVVNGVSSTLVANGSEITVRSGQARLTLEKGGVVGVCGPAQFTVLKSGDAVMIALQHGCVRPRLEPAVSLSVYTALVVVTPVSISGGVREFTAGLDASGSVCVRASQGAARVEQQLSGENVIVPQGGEVSLAGGKVLPPESGSTACLCEILAAKRAPAPVEVVELSAPARPAFRLPAPQAPRVPESKAAEEEVARLASAPGRENPKPATSAEPIYQVLMPPLTFNAASPEPPPDPRPETILLVRRVRVRPSVIFVGTVEAAPAPVAAPAPAPVAQANPQPAPAPPPTAKPEPKREPGVMDRIRSFIRRLTSR